MFFMPLLEAQSSSLLVMKVGKNNLKAKGVKMRKIGLAKLDVITVFKRTFADRVEEDLLIGSIAKAVGEAIEENNKRLSEELEVILKERGG
jgi:hypothetical protein